MPWFCKYKCAINALTADGTPQVKNDTATKNGLSPRVFTKRMVKAIETKNYEVYIGQKEILGLYLKRFFPKLLHKVVLRNKVR